MRHLLQFIPLVLSFFFLNPSFAQFPEGLQIINQNLVENGDFSQENRGFQTAYSYTNEESYAYGPMVDEGEYGVTNNPQRIHHQFAACSDHSNKGNMMVVNGSPKDNEVIWSQKINVKRNTHYVFSCWIASAHATAPAFLQFSINGVNHKDPINAPSTTCEWKQFSTVWESQHNESITISIVNKNTVPMGNDFLLDDITFYECIPANKTSSSTLSDAPTAIRTLHSEADLVCGETIILDNVKFHDNTNKFKGMIAANQTLFLIFEHMKAHPNTTLTLYGHTDVFGSEEHNILLSKQRVVKIQRWLTMYGIKAHRIHYEWFGSSKPLVPEGDSSNRRVEIKMDCGSMN